MISPTTRHKDETSLCIDAGDFGNGGRRRWPVCRDTTVQSPAHQTLPAVTLHGLALTPAACSLSRRTNGVLKMDGRLRIVGGLHRRQHPSSILSLGLLLVDRPCTRRASCWSAAPLHRTPPSSGLRGANANPLKKNALPGRTVPRPPACHRPRPRRRLRGWSSRH